jgi:hypothetical protein
MLRVLLPVFTIVLLLMAAPASAIPICPAATMADYLGFGATGCNLSGVTISGFTYLGESRSLPEGVLPAELVTVTPDRGPFPTFSIATDAGPTPPPGADFDFRGWHSLFLDFKLAAGPAPLVGAMLHMDASGMSGLHGSAFVSVRGTLGSGPVLDLILFTNPSDERLIFHDAVVGAPRFTDTLSLVGVAGPASALRTVDIGIIVAGDSSTLNPVPEPTTLLLWGTGAAGHGLARWARHRRKKTS